MVAATHCFDRGLMDTLVKDNVDPIAESSKLVMAATLHGVCCVFRVACEGCVARARARGVFQRCLCVSRAGLVSCFLARAQPRTLLSRPFPRSDSSLSHRRLNLSPPCLDGVNFVRVCVCARVMCV